MKKLNFLFLVSLLLSISNVQAATYTATGSSTTYTEGSSITYSEGEYTSFTSAEDGAGTYSADNLMASDSIGSGSATELAFLDAVTGTDSSATWAKTDMDTYSSSVYQVASGVYELDVTGFLGGYFMLKIGTSGTSQDSHWIFENTPSLGKLTWLAAIQGNDSLTRLSHFTLCSNCEPRRPGTGGEVPIPAAIWLFGSALLGFTAFGSKKKAA